MLINTENYGINNNVINFRASSSPALLFRLNFRLFACALQHFVCWLISHIQCLWSIRPQEAKKKQRANGLDVSSHFFSRFRLYIRSKINISDKPNKRVIKRNFIA